jgi:hypothetical protein
MFVANSSALIAPFIPFEAARTIYGDPRGLISWGPPNQNKLLAVPGGYRVTGEWHFSSGYRQGHLDRRARQRRRNPTARCATTASAGRPCAPVLMPKAETKAIHDWHTLGMRGTASEGYSVRRRLRAGSLLRHARGSDPAARTRARSMPSPCRASMPAAWRRWRSASPAPCSMPSSSSPPPRRRAISRGSPTIPASSPTWRRREADIGSARAWLVEI